MAEEIPARPVGHRVQPSIPPELGRALAAVAVVAETMPLEALVRGVFGLMTAVHPRAVVAIMATDPGQHISLPDGLSGAPFLYVGTHPLEGILGAIRRGEAAAYPPDRPPS